jgi:two-component system, OmpR family, alkaline phosphatase synthesis response regulator PhoP
LDPTVLLVEDEDALRTTVGDRLRNEGFVVDYAVDGDEGFEKATQLPFDLIILDLMLPGRDGLSMCRDLRSAGFITPILMLTARGRIEDKVTGLKIGADDYVTKPFSMQELLARVEALLRRTPARTSTAQHRSLKFGDIRVDPRAMEVTRDGQVVDLSVREFHLLKYFIEHAGATLSREQLLTDVWGFNAGVFTRTVDVHVASLRQKLESDPKHPTLIRTVQRVGYRFITEHSTT